MKTTFDQKDIESALTTYAKASGIHKPVDSITFKMARNTENGLTAEVEFGHAALTDGAKQAMPACTAVATTDDDAGTTTATETIEPTVIQTADVVVSPSGDAVPDVTSTEPATQANDTQADSVASSDENIFAK